MKTWNSIYGLRKTNQTFCEDGSIACLPKSSSLEIILIAACITGLVSNTHGAEAEQIDLNNTLTPDLEFLEFLGQFETDAGEWIYPDKLLAEDFVGLFTEPIDAASGNEPETSDNGNSNDQKALKND